MLPQGLEGGTPLPSPLAEGFPLDGASCAPCELDAYLSPDGTLLAYRIRPDAFWNQEGSGIEWRETTGLIPGEVVVIGLATGSVLFRTDVAAQDRLGDFDGRFLVIEGPHASTIVDSRSEHAQWRTTSDVELLR